MPISPNSASISIPRSKLPWVGLISFEVDFDANILILLDEGLISFDVEIIALATSSKSASIGSIVFLSSGMDKALVGEALADHAANGLLDEAHGASLRGVLAERKFVDVAMQVLGGDM